MATSTLTIDRDTRDVLFRELAVALRSLALAATRNAAAIDRQESAANWAKT